MATPIKAPPIKPPKPPRLQDRPFMLDEPIPRVCVISDLCRLIRISRPQIYHLRRLDKFPIPEIEPRMDGRPRYLGENVRRYLAGEPVLRKRRR